VIHIPKSNFSGSFEYFPASLAIATSIDIAEQQIVKENGSYELRLYVLLDTK